MKSYLMINFKSLVVRHVECEAIEQSAVYSEITNFCNEAISIQTLNPPFIIDKIVFQQLVRLPII